MKFSVRDVLLYIAQQPLIGMPTDGVDNSSFKYDTLRRHIQANLPAATSVVADLNEHFKIPEDQELSFSFVLDAAFITIAQRIVTIKQGWL